MSTSSSQPRETVRKLLPSKMGSAMDQRRRFRTEGKQKMIRRVVAFAFPRAAFLVLVGYFGLSAVAAAAPFEPEMICRAALGSVTDRDPKRFRVTHTDSSVLLLSYVRRLDNFVWTYRCKVEGDRVIWASEPGRWRENPKDDKISFEVAADGKQLRIINDRNGRSPTKLLFDLDKLR
jgi:hypothetical protein